MGMLFLVGIPIFSYKGIIPAASLCKTTVGIRQKMQYNTVNSESN